MSAANQPLLLITEPAGFSVRERLKPIARLREGPFTRWQLLHAVRDIQILWVRLGHRIDKEVLDAAHHLRCIVSPTTGLNHIDVDWCARRGIQVLSLRGEAKFLRSITATAEHTLGLILALLRHTVPAHESVCRGIWDRERFIGRQASNLTLGIIGLGRLGHIVSRLARPLFDTILGCDPFAAHSLRGVRRASLNRLLSTADVLTLHAPSSPQTHHMVDAKFLRRIKRGAYLVNTSRGDLIDEGKLLKALRNRTLAGAALDVLEEENSGQFDPRTQPLVRYAANHTNLILTPHVGGATIESMAATEAYMASKLRQKGAYVARR